MPSTREVTEISSADLAWFKGLSRAGIGLWQKGNRPLKSEEFDRIKALISAHSLPVELKFDCHDVWFITIYIPPSVPGLKPESALSLAGDNVPGYVYAKRHSNDYAEDELVPLARNKRNRELIALYELRSVD